MERIFSRFPVIWTTQNSQPNQPPLYHAKYFGHYSRLSTEHVEHLAAIGALEFHSWFPTMDDPQRARFAGFLLERQWNAASAASEEAVREGALLFKALLESDGPGRKCAGRGE